MRYKYSYLCSEFRKIYGKVAKQQEQSKKIYRFFLNSLDTQGKSLGVFLPKY